MPPSTNTAPPTDSLGGNGQPTWDPVQMPVLKYKGRTSSRSTRHPHTHIGGDTCGDTALHWLSHPSCLPESMLWNTEPRVTLNDSKREVGIHYPGRFSCSRTPSGPQLPPEHPNSLGRTIISLSGQLLSIMQQGLGGGRHRTLELSGHSAPLTHLEGQSQDTPRRRHVPGQPLGLGTHEP